MATTINFDNELNASVQVGDIVYHCTTSTSTASQDPLGNFQKADATSVAEVGPITAIDFANKQITVDKANDVTLTTDDFIFFSKDNRANNSGLLGYYALVKFRNNDVDSIGDSKPEMFAATCEVFESSK